MRDRIIIFYLELYAYIHAFSAENYCHALLFSSPFPSLQIHAICFSHQKVVVNRIYKKTKSKMIIISYTEAN